MNAQLNINRRRVVKRINDGASFGWAIYKVARRHKLDRETIVSLVEAVRVQLKRSGRPSSWPR